MWKSYSDKWAGNIWWEENLPDSLWDNDDGENIMEKVNGTKLGEQCCRENFEGQNSWDKYDETKLVKRAWGEKSRSLGWWDTVDGTIFIEKKLI